MHKCVIFFAGLLLTIFMGWLVWITTVMVDEKTTPKRNFDKKK